MIILQVRGNVSVDREPVPESGINKYSIKDLFRSYYGPDTVFGTGDSYVFGDVK